jgi:glycosyltransferase involved in cell wall biosynthesis
LDLRYRRAKLIHTPSLNLPAMAGCRRVATIVDLAPFVLPELYSRRERKAIDTTLRRADVLIVPSQSMAEEVSALESAADKPAHVTPAGVDPTFRPLDPDQCSEVAQERYGLPPGYILSIGQAPAKNRGAILRALRRLLDEGRQLQLAVVSDEGSPEDRRTVTALGLDANVTFCGFLPQTELPQIYNAASLLLQPSLHDGLALPTLEAMACGTPLVIADRSTPAELADEAALKVDPYDIDAIASAAAQLLDDPTLVSRLRFEGIKRAAEFSWEACAEKTAAVYAEILAGR